MKKIYMLAGLLGALSTVSVSTVNAGNYPGAVTFGMAGAYYHFAGKRNVDNTFMPNLALAYNLTDRWAIEAGAGNLNTNFSGSGGTVHAMLYTLDGIYRFSPTKYFEPYVLAGVGVINLKPPVGTTNQYQSNINAGIGTQWFADKKIALRGEIRDLYTMSGGMNDVMVNFGLSFLFG